jgi:MFS family permease
VITGLPTEPRQYDRASVRWTAVTGLLCLAAAMGVGRFAFTPLLPMMLEEGLLDVGAGGLLASVHFLGYLLGALMAARLPGTARTTLVASLLVIAASTAGMGVTHSMPAWLLFRFAAGVCSAFTLVAVGMHFVRRLSEMGGAGVEGWVFSGVGAGIALVGLAVLGLMLRQNASASGWVLFGAATCAVAVLVWLREQPVKDGSGRDGGGEGVRVPFSWRIVVAYGCMGAGYIVPATFLPVMAHDLIDDPRVFGWGWPIFGAAAFLSTIFAARFYSLFSNLQIWKVSQFIMAAGLIAPALYPHVATVLLAALCVGGTFMIITMCGIKYAHANAPGEARRHIAVLTAAFATGQVVAPVLAGFTYDLTHGFTLPLMLTGILLAVTSPHSGKWQREY